MKFTKAIIYLNELCACYGRSASPSPPIGTTNKNTSAAFFAVYLVGVFFFSGRKKIKTKKHRNSNLMMATWKWMGFVLNQLCGFYWCGCDFIVIELMRPFQAGCRYQIISQRNHINETRIVVRFVFFFDSKKNRISFFFLIHREFNTHEYFCWNIVLSNLVRVIIYWL